jgi:glycosyltransferase involved in cell wall biosynthesis
MSKHAELSSPAGVDVVVPSYQYGRFLRECVMSVLTQDIRQVRVLIIDNASSDESVEVARQLAAEDRRVQVVARQHNLGPHASYNEGIDWASAKYFVMLCADDLLAPRSLRRAVSIMERHADVALAYGRALWLRPEDPMPDLDADAGDTPWRSIPGRDLLERFCRTAFNHFSGPVVVRTTAQKLAGHYRPELPHTDDFEMWMRLACLGQAAEMDACQGISRVHGLNRSTFSSERGTANLAKHERERTLYNWHEEAAFKSFFANEGRSLPEAARLHRMARRSLAERAYWAAVTRLCRGQTDTSRVLLAFALRRRPRAAFLPPVSYLFRRDDALRRMISVASDAIGRFCRPGMRGQMGLDPWG